MSSDSLSLNHFLASLAEAELRELAPRLQGVTLRQGSRLCDEGEGLKHVYFPTAGIVSIVHVSGSGALTALTMIGCEGMVGVTMLLGTQATMQVRALVQASGFAYRLAASEAKAVFARGGRFHLLALDLARQMIQQIAQTALCNLHHTVEQQLSRWLLLSLDRMPNNELSMTHEMIAGMLGVRRQGVTEAAKRLEKRNAIAYFRGHIVVLNRRALEVSACECYAATRLRSHPKLPDPPAIRPPG
jgi:CRP-like cAMP-binding protein